MSWRRRCSKFCVAVASGWDERTLRWLVLGGFSLRLALLLVSEGSNDIATWERFAGDIEQWGVIEEYRRAPDFNHPPLMGWWSVIALKAATLTSIPFRFWFKLLPLAADVVATRLAWSIGRRGGLPLEGWRAAAVMSTGLVSIWVTSHHGNTDSVCALLVLVSAWCLHARDAPLVAGLAFAGALNVKLIPLIALPTLVLQLRSIDAALRFGAGLAVGLLPFLPPALMVWDEFFKNAIQYTSNRNRWGIRGILIAAQELEPAATPVRVMDAVWARLGRYVIMGLSLLIGLRARHTRLTPYHVCALALALFLFFAPGFGVQYMIYPFALLVAADLRRAAIYGFLAGLFAGADYLHYATRWFPLTTAHSAPFAWWVAAFGFISWFALGELLVTQLLATRRDGDGRGGMRGRTA